MTGNPPHPVAAFVAILVAAATGTPSGARWTGPWACPSIFAGNNMATKQTTNWRSLRCSASLLRESL